MTYREILDKSDGEINQLKRIIADLEDKNKKLNDKINYIIYNKAALYKERTF